MADFQLPEMLRTPLEELVLQIKILGLGKVMPFLAKAIEPPSDTAVANALECLQELVRCEVCSPDPWWYQLLLSPQLSVL